MQGFLLCKTCSTLMNLVFDYFSKDLSNEELIDIGSRLCIDLHLYDEKFCRGIVETNVVNSIYHRDNNYNFNSFGINFSRLSNTFTTTSRLFLEICVVSYCHQRGANSLILRSWSGPSNPVPIQNLTS